MKAEQQHTYEKVILGLELFGFGAVLLVLWLDEYVDVPFRFFGALQTPARPQEFWFEAVTVLLVATAVVAATLWVFRRLRFLEGSSRSAPGAGRWKWRATGSISSNISSARTMCTQPTASARPAGRERPRRSLGGGSRFRADKRNPWSGEATDLRS